MNVTRLYCLVIGTAFVLAGIAGFLPIFTTAMPSNSPELVLGLNYALLIGLFPVNVLHNLFHLVAGFIGILAAENDLWARRYCQGLSIVLAAFTIMGLLPSVSTAFGLLPLFGHDVWLHGMEAAVAAYLGFVWHEQARYRKRKFIS